jgi:UDP-N-acetyl-D-glucosamine dehydrogenase
MNITVVGQGYVGLPIAIKAAEIGFNVVGLDSDVEKVTNLKSGFTDLPEIDQKILLELQARGKLKFISKLDTKVKTDIFIIAVPTPLDLNHNPDLSMLEKACLTISQFIQPNSLVINESTSYIGTLRNFVKFKIEQNCRIDNIEYAVAPERIDPSNSNWNITNTPRIVSGLTDNATKRAFDFYRNFCKTVYKVSTPEVAEAAKLFENTFRLVNISLVNELSELASILNFSMHEVISAAATKPFGFMPFYPGIGIGGHCIPVDPTYLNFSAKNVGLESNFINLANRINLFMPEQISKRIQNELGGNLKKKRIQIAGISYKPNVADLRESPALTLIQKLRDLGAEVSWFDPLVKEFNSEKSIPLMVDIDLGIIVTPHNEIDFSTWKLSGTRVIDLSSNPRSYGWPKFL